MDVISADAPAGAAACPHVLIVDDHPDTLTMMSVALGLWGYTVSSADRIEAAVAVAAATPVDLLVCDLRLPDGAGLDLPRRLPAPVPAVMLSGCCGEDDVRASRAAGFAAHLPKPIDLVRLRDVLRELCPAPAIAQAVSA